MGVTTKRRKVAVILRVYDRTRDCLVNIEVIKKYWTINDYYIVLVTNGVKDGYTLPKEMLFNGKIVEVESNSGHIAGNAGLLAAGLDNIPSDCEYTVILESDTWLLNDRIIDRYINRLEKDEKLVWASANWVDKYFSLAVDFALIKTGFLHENRKIFDFKNNKAPECYIFNYLKKIGCYHLKIKEIGPVHLPKIVPWGPQVSGRRRRAFPLVPMVTHHIEELSDAISSKKEIANCTAGETVFPEVAEADKNVMALKMYRYFYIAYQKMLFMAPRSRWFKGRKVNKL